MNLRDCIGKTIKKILLECFYLEGIYISIVRLYIAVDNIFYDITCSEENVFIRTQEEIPQDLDEGEFYYKLEKQNIEWLQQNKVISIKYLIDSLSIKRGILFIFENGHNFIFYNKGYEFDDEDRFEIDVDVESLPYSLSNINLS